MSADPLADLDAIDQCWCSSCAAKLDKERTFYRLCPDCGNKRCPKGTNHEHACSGSNDSGQYGSSYGVMCALSCCYDYRESVDRQQREFDAWAAQSLSEDGGVQS
jgi:hypothetical protein